MKHRKIIGCLAICAFLTCVPGCDVETGENASPTGYTNRIDYMDEAVVTIDDTEVGYREAMLYLQAARQQYEGTYGDEIWEYMLKEDGETLGEWVTDQTLEQIVYIKIVCAQAKRLGIELDSEEKNRIVERVEDYMGKANYETLAAYGIARKDVERVYADTALAQKIYDSVTLNVDTDITNKSVAQKRLQSMMLKNYHEDELGNRTSLTVQELIATLDRFELLYEQAQSTTDFYSLAYANTEDKEYLDMTVGEGDLPEAFREAYNLEEGEVMQIRTDNGYYIFYCVSGYDEDATIAKKEELIAKRQEETFRTLYEQWRKEAKIVFNEGMRQAIRRDMEAES